MTVVKCPSCGTQTEFEGNEFRPFCSERCQLLDFGAWTDEEYSLPAETNALTEEDLEKLQRTLEERSK